MKMPKSLFYQMNVSGNGIVFLKNLKILILIMNDFVFVLVLFKYVSISEEKLYVIRYDMIILSE